MNQIARLGLALAAALLLTACGSRTSPVGRYHLDSEHFAQTVTSQLIDQGKIPPAAEDRAMAVMRAAKFNLELREDNTFAALQVVGKERHAYTGTWTLNGTAFQLLQTQEDGRDRSDSLSGTLVGDTITVQRVEQGIDVTMHLRRAPVAASPR